MAPPLRNNPHWSDPPLTSDPQGVGHRILVVEPDRLARWSICSYLQRWFLVCSAESAPQAEFQLKNQVFDGVIISCEIPSEAIDTIEQTCRDRNPETVLIITVTDTTSHLGGPGSARKQLEKPFQLAKMAQLLGVPTQ
jgi:DNA-binding response OmpR family regulator